MEEWEDRLQAEIEEIISKYSEEGLTIRQVIGVLETTKAVLNGNILIVEDEE